MVRCWWSLRLSPRTSFSPLWRHLPPTQCTMADQSTTDLPTVEPTMEKENSQGPSKRLRKSSVAGDADKRKSVSFGMVSKVYYEKEEPAADSPAIFPAPGGASSSSAAAPAPPPAPSAAAPAPVAASPRRSPTPGDTQPSPSDSERSDLFFSPVESFHWRPARRRWPAATARPT